MNFFKEIWASITKRDYKTTSAGVAVLAVAAMKGYLAYLSPTPENIATTVTAAATGVGLIMASDASPKVQAVGAKVTAAGQSVNGLEGILAAATPVVKAAQDQAAQVAGQQAGEAKAAQIIAAVQAISGIAAEVTPEPPVTS
jgi:hypothetical protein